MKKYLYGILMIGLSPFLGIICMNLCVNILLAITGGASVPEEMYITFALAFQCYGLAYIIIKHFDKNK